MPLPVDQTDMLRQSRFEGNGSEAALPYLPLDRMGEDDGVPQAGCRRGLQGFGTARLQDDLDGVGPSAGSRQEGFRGLAAAGTRLPHHGFVILEGAAGDRSAAGQGMIWGANDAQFRLAAGFAIQARQRPRQGDEAQIPVSRSDALGYGRGIGNVQLHRHLGVESAELGQQGRQKLVTDARGSAHPQRAAHVIGHFRQAGLHLATQGEDAFGVAESDSAGGRQVEDTLAPLQKACVQFRFQLPNLEMNRRLAHEQGFRCT